ncbi:MAG: 50S ribosomal protein L10 [Candidatus Paceibacterota bacterium]|jgi:large subunit ribosomal protein L10
MARTKAQKREVLNKLEKIIGEAKSLVFVNIHGLKVADATTMRRQMTQNGVGFFVAKKSLTSKALAAQKFTGTEPVLSGEAGLAYGLDLIAPAREVYDFQKKLKDQIAIMGGVFENKYMTKEEMTAIAAIPSLQTLRGMFVNVINSPIQGLVVALSKIAEQKG